jgi:hypothetical protein
MCGDCLNEQRLMTWNGNNVVAPAMVALGHSFEVWYLLLLGFDPRISRELSSSISGLSSWKIPAEELRQLKPILTNNHNQLGAFVDTWATMANL